MGNISETLLAKIGTTQELLNKFIESKRGHHRPLARLRFDMTLSQAYAKILESYMYEVQSRDCYYENDEYVAEAMYEIARNLIKEHPKKGVLLNGFCGNGKTTLAKGILTAIRDLNKEKHFKWDGGEATIADMTTRIVNAVDLCHLAQAGENKLLDFYKNVDVLLIDDLGIEPREIQVYGNGFHTVREVLNARYDNLKFTVITTNLTSSQLRDFYEERISSRFREMVQQITMKGPSFRDKINDNE